MYENIDKTKYTPMMQQYLEIKEQYKDTLVFFRLGDFYEMFFNDAIVASRELEIVLTGRDAGTQNEKVPMCGVPFHAVDGYIEKLSEKGYKVAIVEQLEQPGTHKIVKRDVIRVVTPGTNIDESYLSDKSNNYIAALEKINNGYALAYIDLSTGEAKLTSFPSQIDLVYSEISKLNIKELVVDPSLPKSYQNHFFKIYNVLVSTYSETTIDSYLEGLVKDLDDLYLSCAKRLLSYIVKTQKRVLVHLTPFVYYNSKEFLHLDSNAVRNLELVESLRGNRHKNNLFTVLDKCSTAMGSRYLKRSILFPLVDVNKIHARQNFIEELHKSYLQMENIKSDLFEVYDLERIVGRISFGTLSPKDLIQLKKSLLVLPDIKKSLNKMKGSIGKEKANLIENFDLLAKELSDGIRDDAPYSLKDGGVIKDGFSEELDKIKNVASSNKEYLASLELREREKTGIKNLKVGYNKVFGYYIEITKANLGLVKDEFGYIRKQTTSNSERYITQELKEREALILRSSDMALELEYKLFDQIRTDCKNESSRLQALANVLSEIDMLISLATVAKENNYVKPSISLYDEFEIIEGRHPVIEAVSDDEFIPNDLTLYNNEKILLITGPNMAGKSTYMRQNALIAIMTQMGSFVPAKSATLPIFDKIFTRIGSSDDIASGESTFMTEMIEVNTAIQNATERSLIILDEVGRGTATFDGMALAQAIIEYLHDTVGAKTFFSTHYHELTSLEKSLPYLRNVHVEAVTNEKTGDIVFLHKVLDGASDQSYGINVARLAHIPVEVTLRANDILSKITNKSNYDIDLLSKDNYQKPVIIDKVNPIYKEVVDEIKNIDLDSLTPINALMLIDELKKKVSSDE